MSTNKHDRKVKIEIQAKSKTWKATTYLYTWAVRNCAHTYAGHRSTTEAQANAGRRQFDSGRWLGLPWRGGVVRPTLTPRDRKLEIMLRTNFRSRYRGHHPIILGFPQTIFALARTPGNKGPRTSGLVLLLWFACCGGLRGGGLCGCVSVLAGVGWMLSTAALM